MSSGLNPGKIISWL